MKIYKDMDIEDFDFWGGAKDRMNEITDAKIEEEVFDIIRDTFVDEEYVEDTAINDFVWFDLDKILEEQGLYDPATGEYGEREDEKDEDDEDEDDEDEDEDEDWDEDWDEEDDEDDEY